MFLAQNFEIEMPINAARMPEISIAARRIARFWAEIVLRISEIAAAEPERALFIV